MSNPLLFEGRDLEEVLSEAQLVFGPEVEIVQANRVRKGGVFGFFAREWYEVWAHGPASLANPALALLDRDATVEEIDTFQSMVTNALAAQAPSDGFDSAMERFFDDDDRRGGGGAPIPSAPATPAAAPVVAPAGGGVAVAERPEPATLAEALGTPLPDAAPMTDRAAAAMATTSAAVALEDAPRGASIFDEPRQPRTDLLWSVLDRIETMTAIPQMPEQGIVVFIGEASTALPLVQELGHRLGLWGNEVAVVTRRHHDDIPTWLAIDDLGDLQSRAPRWAKREGVVPVIIDDSIDKPSLDWIGEALDALCPAQTRLVAEAWRLPEQVGRVALRLGGVDAIELAQSGDTIDPLALLDLDIPIGSVEGRPASPELLAAVWLDRRRRG
ncbi:MAG: hypothetical protein AAGA90_16415 [Actinomycetota bacterium]